MGLFISFSSWVEGGLSIVPNKNLVSNIGFGSQGVNCKDNTSPFASMDSYSLPNPLRHPSIVQRDVDADDYTASQLFTKESLILKFLRYLSQPNLFIGKIAIFWRSHVMKSLIKNCE